MEEDESIEVVVESDFAEYCRILYERAKESIKLNRVLLGLEIVAIISLSLGAYLTNGFDDPMGLTLLLVVSIFFALHLIGYLALMKSIRSQAKKWTGTGEPITYTLSPKGMKSSSKLVTWVSPWSRFTQVIETDSDLLFIIEGDDFVPIPKRSVSDPTVLEQMRRLIASNATGTVKLLS